MIGLVIAVIIFNAIAFKTNHRLTVNQIVHIWTFTIALQVLVDTFVDFKYHGYWYFSRDIEWYSLPAVTLLVPPANIIFLNGYPFGQSIIKQMMYYIVTLIVLNLYELIALLPHPWGYFHYGWWRLWYSSLINPFLLAIILLFYKGTIHLEKKLSHD